VTLAAVGFGETFGLYRNPGRREGDGFQANIAGGLFAQFNLDAPSSDLINADYVIGLPLTYRAGPNAVRLRVYHQSSHLGDEFLLGPSAPPRQNLSFESLELLGSRDFDSLRLYLGVEYRGAHPLFGTTRLVGGLDLKSWQQQDWEVSANLTFGLEFDSPAGNHRRLRLPFEAYDGFAPYGQFYEEEITYFGFGLSFGL